jgi:hypothetical protein
MTTYPLKESQWKRKSTIRGVIEHCHFREKLDSPAMEKLSYDYLSARNASVEEERHDPRRPRALSLPQKQQREIACRRFFEPVGLDCYSDAAKDSVIISHSLTVVVMSRAFTEAARAATYLWCRPRTVGSRAASASRNAAPSASWPSASTRGSRPRSSGPFRGPREALCPGSYAVHDRSRPLRVRKRGRHRVHVKASVGFVTGCTFASSTQSAIVLAGLCSLVARDCPLLTVRRRSSCDADAVRSSRRPPSESPGGMPSQSPTAAGP